MKFEIGIYEYLSTDSGVGALVTDDEGNCRIYPVRLPEGATLPAISWQRISGDRIYTHDGYADTKPWTTARIQFNAWSNTSEEEAMLLGDAILLALSGYEGDLGGQVVGSSFAVTDRDDYEAQTKIYRRILDFQISYEDDSLGESS